MAYQLEKFGSGTMDKGIRARSMDFQADVCLNLESNNMTQGIQQGLGPRYGFSPIPGQLSSDAPTGSNLPNLQYAERTSAPAQGFYYRQRILGVVPMILPDPADVTKNIKTYAFILDTFLTSENKIDIVFCSTYSGGEVISADIRNGFTTPSVVSSTSITGPGLFVEGIVPSSGSRLGPLRDFLQIPSTQWYANFDFASISAGDIPMQWFAGDSTANGDVNHAPSAKFGQMNNLLAIFGDPLSHNGGIPSEYNLKNYRTASRTIKVFALRQDGAFNIEYTVPLTPSSSVFKPDWDLSNTVNLDLAGVTAVKNTAGTNYSANRVVLVNDNACITTSAYKAILVAQGRAIMCIFQDAWKAPNKRFNQWFDVTQKSFDPNTGWPGAGGSGYSEDGVRTPTIFASWPNFVNGTALPTYTGAPTNDARLGPANSGILRSNTVYEFSYSLYNKRLNTETNVGRGVKIQTGANDYVSLAIGGPFSQFERYGNPCALPYLFSAGSIINGDAEPINGLLALNFYEYRFYYRQLGSFEWLPALTLDAPKFWLYPWPQPIWACQGPVSGSVGGQPGGFNDYSNLEKDNWIDVKMYKNRAFWFSPKQVRYSMSNNLFAYPIRNSIAAPSGQFLGGLVHNYPGQAEQSSRLVIFSTTGTFVARFTGVRSQMSVQVSAEESGVFDLDGSDLVCDPWTSVTAFSSRSAVVAEGLLYWWGPQGIFRDDGVETPSRISEQLEPDLFSIYDPNKTSEIHASYNPQTKEIQWFFTPKTSTSDGETNQSLVYNILSGEWTRSKYFCQVDWSQPLNVESNIGTAGTRQLVGVRANAAATTQRAYYLDQRNRAGDMAPGNEVLISGVADVSSTVKRLTLASTGATINMAAGDYLALQQTTAYSGLTANDMIATIAAVNPSSIDITLPAGAVLSNGTLALVNYFPVWHKSQAGRGMHAIPYLMSTQYWVPKGINGYYFWLYLYMLSKFTAWKTNAILGPTVGYRSPTAQGIITDPLTYANNSDGNWQVYHPLRPGNDNHEGQGLKLQLSGYHIGHEWVLQYIELHGTPRPGDVLKRFEG